MSGAAVQLSFAVVFRANVNVNTVYQRFFAAGFIGGQGGLVATLSWLVIAYIPTGLNSFLCGSYHRASSFVIEHAECSVPQQQCPVSRVLQANASTGSLETLQWILILAQCPAKDVNLLNNPAGLQVLQVLQVQQQCISMWLLQIQQLWQKKFILKHCSVSTTYLLALAVCLLIYVARPIRECQLLGLSSKYIVQSRLVAS